MKPIRLIERLATIEHEGRRYEVEVTTDEDAIVRVQVKKMGGPFWRELRYGPLRDELRNFAQTMYDQENTQ